MSQVGSQLKDLAKLYDILLSHLEKLAKLSETVEIAIGNLEEIKNINEKHIQTRKFASELLSEDFSELAPNFLVAFMFKEINPQSILFINLITDYNDRLVKYIQDNNTNELKELIVTIKEFNHSAKKQFKPLRDTFEKMSKKQ